MMLFFIFKLFYGDPFRENAVRITARSGEQKFHLTDKILHSCESTLTYYWYSGISIFTSQGGYSGKLLDGPYERIGSSGNLIESGTFKNGLKHGLWRYWNHNGFLISTEQWNHGRLHGNSEIFLDGKLISRTKFRKGLQHGKSKWFQDDLQIDECSFINGREKLHRRRILWR